MILCAGTSRRFGRNKMLAELAGRPLLAHTIEHIRPQVSDLALNGEGSAYDQFELPVFEDSQPGKLGPLAGVLTAMEWAISLGQNHVLSVSGDTPFLPDNLVTALSARLRAKGGAYPILARTGQQIHQVCGLWPVGLAENLRGFLQNGQSYKVRDFLTSIREVQTVLFVHEAGMDPFFNVNTPADMALAEKMALGAI